MPAIATSGGIGYYYAVGQWRRRRPLSAGAGSGAGPKRSRQACWNWPCMPMGRWPWWCVLSLLAIGEVALGARRVTRGVDLLAAGAPQVRVEHHYRRRDGSPGRSL